MNRGVIIEVLFNAWKAGFEQKVPNNKRVKWMEEDIGLVRERTKEVELCGGCHSARYRTQENTTE